MPTPKKGELEKDFVDRCIPIVIEEGTAEDGTQASVICHSIFDEHNKKNINMTQLRNISAFIREIPANADETRTVEFVISDSTRDRHNTVLNQNGWRLDNYMRNPIVGYNHNVYGGGFFAQASPDNVIGKSTVALENGKLIGKVTFEPVHVNTLAEKIFQKIKFGTLRAASVGFSEIGEGKYGEGEEARGKSNETYYFSGQELMEWSIVNIPSNPSATKRDGYKEPTVEDIIGQIKQMELVFDNKQIQQLSIIDLLKSMEGIKELKLDKLAEEKKICDLYEKRLHLIGVK